MEFPKLRRLLKTREYRSMYFQYIKAKIVNFVKKPIVCIKAIYNAFKFEKTSPSSWERYLRLKQIENEAKEVEEKSVTYVQFVGTISMFNISLISYCSYIERNDLSHEKFQKLHEEFHKKIGLIPDFLYDSLNFFFKMLIILFCFPVSSPFPSSFYKCII